MLSSNLFVDVLTGRFTKGFPIKFSMYTLTPPLMENFDPEN